MRTQCVPDILSSLRTEVHGLVIWHLNDCYICMLLYVCVCEFRDEILLSGEECEIPDKVK